MALVLAGDAAWTSPVAGREGRPTCNVKLLSSIEIPTGRSYRGHLIFGLSGIDYDPATKTFITVRDNYLAKLGDRGSPVAFTLRPVFKGGRYTLRLSGVNTLYAARDLSSLESIRYDPTGNGLWLASEGPNAIYHLASDGTRTRLPLPDGITQRTPAGGDNYGFEGLTFAPDRSIWVSREDSMAGDATGVVRLSNIATDGSLLRQVAYALDDVIATRRGNATISNPPGQGVGNNGVSEILAVSDKGLLVMERAWDGRHADATPSGVSHNYIRIYGIDLTSGSNVSKVSTLTDLHTFRPVVKTLLFDSQWMVIARALDTYDTKIDNLEGMTFGPTLPNGHRTLVLVSDNGDSYIQRKTQFIVIDIGKQKEDISNNRCALTK